MEGLDLQLNAERAAGMTCHWHKERGEAVPHPAQRRPRRAAAPCAGRPAPRGTQSPPSARTACTSAPPPTSPARMHAEASPHSANTHQVQCPCMVGHEKKLRIATPALSTVGWNSSRSDAVAEKSKVVRLKSVYKARLDGARGLAQVPQCRAAHGRQVSVLCDAVRCPVDGGLVRVVVGATQGRHRTCAVPDPPCRCQRLVAVPWHGLLCGVLRPAAHGMVCNRAACACRP